MVAEILVVMIWWLFGFSGISSGGDTVERPVGAGGPLSCGLRQPIYIGPPRPQHRSYLAGLLTSKVMGLGSPVHSPSGVGRYRAKFMA